MRDIPRGTALSALLAAASAGAARAADWPERPVTWLMPFAAGGAADVFSRPIAAHLGRRFGQNMVIDNRSGAGGTLAASMAARAAADGQTLLIGHTGLCYAPILYPAAGFDLARDFEPIAAFARVAMLLVVNPARLDVGTLGQFVEAARKAPGRIDMAFGGLGTVPHLAIEALQQRAGVRFHHVPYRGAPALADLLAGQLDALIAPVSIFLQHVRSGKLRALAVAARRAEPLLPDVPTFDATGMGDFRASVWYGLFAPRRTPAAIADRLHDAVQKALVEPDVRQIWAEQAARVELESRADFARFVTAEIERWSRTARAANVKME